MTNTLHHLIRKLEASSATVAALQLVQHLPDRPLAGLFLNLAGRADHQRIMVDGLDALAATRLSQIELRDQAKVLLSENGHYGAFCELGTYGWFARHDIRFEPQIPLTAKDVLNPNGTIIDGKFEAATAYFDIKAMGFTEYMRELFLEKLHAALPGQILTLNGPSDVAVKDIEQYALRRVRQYATALASGPVEVPELHWRLAAHARGGVTTSMLESSPYRAAKANRHYPFKTARQFARRKPFVLVFAWASPFNREFNLDFGDATSTTLRALARRVFLQSVRETRVDVSQFDPSVPPGTTLAKASKLISALLFISLDSEQSFFFINPRAKHPLTRLARSSIFDFNPPRGMLCDDFADDDY